MNKWDREEIKVWSILDRGFIKTLDEEYLIKSRLKHNEDSSGYFTYYLKLKINEMLVDFKQRRLIIYGKV